MTSVVAVTEATSSWDPYARGCPSRDLLDRIGDKWTVLVLGELGRHGACRFTQLRKQLSGVSEKMLTQTLRALERDGIVRRTVYPAVPVRVEYALTPLGQTLREPLKALTEWSVQHIADVLAAREEYDAHLESVLCGQLTILEGRIFALSGRFFSAPPCSAVDRYIAVSADG